MPKTSAPDDENCNVNVLVSDELHYSAQSAGDFIENQSVFFTLQMNSKYLVHLVGPYAFPFISLQQFGKIIYLFWLCGSLLNEHLGMQRVNKRGKLDTKYKKQQRELSSFHQRSIWQI